VTTSWVLVVHIAGGAIAILSGAAAIWSRKGERVHRAFGTIFFVSMLIMASGATYLGVQLGQIGNAVAGAFTFYLVGTAWATVQRGENKIGAFEYIAFVAALGVAAFMLYFGVRGLDNPRLDGTPVAQASIALGGVVAVAALLDLKVIIQGGIAGAARIARHLWRMCFGFFVATGSFFIGQQKIMPAWILEGRPLLFALGLAPLFFLVFWMIRVRMTNWYKSDAIASQDVGMRKLPSPTNSPIRQSVQTTG